MEVLVENPLLVELKSVEKRLGMHAVCTLISFVLFVSFVVIKSTLHVSFQAARGSATRGEQADAPKLPNGAF